ncbi:MAG: hypothetical protein HQM14_16900 [SAR324 cluster bacterium]|nr:hypothetical protein [SAR324 cluster bacterium]
MNKIILIISSILVITGCSAKYPNRIPVGQTFPSISGTSLAGRDVSIPEEFGGKQTILLLGYVQDAQFDIDRWLIGMDQTKVQTNIYEIPAIQGFWPGLFKDRIDEGMRGGIPEELWKIVITVYEDGSLVQQFTGNGNPRNARVMVLDEQGMILFFHDRGFSVAALNQLRSHLKSNSSKKISDGN